MLQFEFNYKNAPTETIAKITGAISKNKIFALKHIDRDAIIIFIPEHNAVIYPVTSLSPSPTKQVCSNRKSFYAVIGMSLYRYKTFQAVNTNLPHIKQLLLTV